MHWCNLRPILCLQWLRPASLLPVNKPAPYNRVAERQGRACGLTGRFQECQSLLEEESGQQALLRNTVAKHRFGLLGTKFSISSAKRGVFIPKDRGCQQ